MLLLARQTKRPSTTLWPLLALGALLIFNLAFTPGFFALEMKEGHLYGTLVDVIDRSAPVMLLALGMTLVIATGGVDLSVGAVMAIAGSVSALLLSREQGTAVAMGLGVVAGLLAGTLNGVLVSSIGIQPIVATLILMVAGRGIAQLLTDGQPVPVENDAFAYLGNGFFLGLPFSVTISLAAFVLTWALTRKTALGLFLESVGGNARASRFAGVAVGSVIFMAYAFSGLCAAVAGLIVTSDIRTADANNTGLYMELDAILAVVIGGTALTGGRFNLLGSLFGAILMQTLTTTILARGVPVEFTLVVKALVILAVCLLQSPVARQRLVAISRRSS